MKLLKCADVDEVRETTEGVQLGIYLWEPLAIGESLTILKPTEKTFTVSQMRTTDNEPITEAGEGVTVNIILGTTAIKFREGMILHKKIEEAVPAKGSFCGSSRRK